jgi:hypothetical protein
MSASSTATVSLLSIATDLGLHIMNYGVPMPTSTAFFQSESGLAFAGTVSGISATAIAGGITSGELDDMVARIPTDYDKSLAKTMSASSVINTKMLTQAGVGVAYMLGMGRPQTELTSWATKQFLPSLFVHGAMAGILPYLM